MISNTFAPCGVAIYSSAMDDATAPMSDELAAQLVANHRRFLAFLEPRVESRAIAEEILQAAFVRGLEKGGELRDGERVSAWFFRLLRNAVVDHYRRRAAYGRALERSAAEQPTAAPAPDDDELNAQVCQCVSALLPSLRPSYAELLERVELGGQSVERRRQGPRHHRRQRRRAPAPRPPRAQASARAQLRHLRRPRLSRLHLWGAKHF